MRRRAEFTATVRGGVRAATPTVVVHSGRSAPSGEVTTPHVGFIVGRGVGSAVVRNRVRRRLRHLVRDHLDRLRPGSTVVVRATAAAAAASTAELAADLDRALARAARRSEVPA